MADGVSSALQVVQGALHDGSLLGLVALMAQQTPEVLQSMLVLSEPAVRACTHCPAAELGEAGGVVWAALLSVPQAGAGDC